MEPLNSQKIILLYLVHKIKKKYYLSGLWRLCIVPKMSNNFSKYDVFIAM